MIFLGSAVGGGYSIDISWEYFKHFCILIGGGGGAIEIVGNITTI